MSIVKKIILTYKKENGEKEQGTLYLLAKKADSTTYKVVIIKKENYLS